MSLAESTTVAEPTQIPSGEMTADASPETLSQDTVSPEAAATIQTGEPAPESTPEPSAIRPTWADVTDAHELVDHPEVKPLIDARVKRLEEDLIIERDRQVKDATDNWQAQQVQRDLTGQLEALRREVMAGDFDDAERILGRIDKLVEPFGSLAQKDAENQGVSQGMAAQAQAFKNVITGHLNERGKDSFASLERRGAQWSEAVDLLKEQWTQPLNAKVTELERQVAELKVAARSGQGPNLAPSNGAGSGRSDNELLADPTTPIETIMEIRARQKAGG